MCHWQHHIWLTSNAKTLLTLVPGYPLLNMGVVTVVYLLVSNEFYRLTMALRGMMLPNDSEACLLNLGGLLSALSICAACARACEWQVPLLRRRRDGGSGTTQRCCPTRADARPRGLPSRLRMMMMHGC